MSKDIVIIESSEREATKAIKKALKDNAEKTLMTIGTGVPREESFEISRITPVEYVSPNGKYCSTVGPIDNKGRHIKPRGSKYHK